MPVSGLPFLSFAGIARISMCRPAGELRQRLDGFCRDPGLLQARAARRPPAKGPRVRSALPWAATGPGRRTPDSLRTDAEVVPPFRQLSGQRSEPAGLIGGVLR